MPTCTAYPNEIHPPKHNAQPGDIYNGPEGGGIVDYVNRMGDVTMKIKGRTIPVHCADFIDSYERIIL